MTPIEVEQLKRQYAGKWVTVDARRPELTRFAGLRGRVAAINFNGRALIEFEGMGPNSGRHDILPEFIELEPLP
jgi:hypothetical protein